MRHDLFPDAHAGDKDARLRRAWCFDYPLPVPARHRPLRCPCCAVGECVLKDWRFHQRRDTGSASPHRVDVRMKCMTCGHVPIFGLPVTPGYFAAAPTPGRWISWRTGKEILVKAGYFD